MEYTTVTILKSKVKKNPHGQFNSRDLSLLRESKKEYFREKPRPITAFFQLAGTDIFLEDASEVYAKFPKDLVRIVRGQFGGTWVHLVVFLKLAEWLDPKLEVLVTEQLYEELLNSRDDGGEEFVKIIDVLKTRFPREFAKDVLLYAKVSNYVANVCSLGMDKERWKHATENQLKTRESFQKALIMTSRFKNTVAETLLCAYKITTRNI